MRRAVQGSVTHERVWQRADPKAGKEETEAFLSKLFSQLQVTCNMVELTGQNEQLLKETWLYGYAPDFTFASSTPQGIGMLKILAAGEVTMYIMKLSEAAAYFQKKARP